jgi:hypothetical protein
MEKSKNSSERDFQTTIEFLFEKLGWSQYRGEIISQQVIPVGSSQSVKPDIIIRQNGQNIFVVELKKPNTILSERNTDQLISYMRLLRLNFGILIGENLQIYYELPDGNKQPIKINEIFFKNDLDTGAEFIEIFGKEGFTLERIAKYCKENLTNLEMIEKSQKYINTLCSDEGIKIVKELITDKLLTEFSESITSSIIENINIRISRKGNEIIQQSNLPLFSTKNTINQTQNITENVLSPSEARRICEKNGLNISGNITFATKNKSSNHYWANPDISYLLSTWWFLLNDNIKRELHVFKIPGNSIDKDKVIVRNDKPNRIDLQIKYGDNYFEDNRSKIQFEQWFIKTISY